MPGNISASQNVSIFDHLHSEYDKGSKTTPLCVAGYFQIHALLKLFSRVKATL